MPRLVPCHCCACGCVVYSVCERCERAQLHDVLVRRGLVADNPVVAAAYDVLASAYLDAGDETDREYERAQSYEMGVGE